MTLLPDANKSPITRQITGLALMWLRERGFKPLAAEVPVAPGWVADIAGMAMLTRTEAIKLKLFQPCRRGYPIGDGQEAVDAYLAAHKAADDAFAAIPAPISCLVEVKVSRADFRKDLARKFSCPRLPAHLCYLAAPGGMLAIDEYPANWGLLVLKGDRVYQVKPPTMQAPSAQEQVGVAWELGCKVDHDQRYEKFRERQKQERARQGEQRARGQASTMAYWLVDLVEGKEPSWPFEKLPPAQQAAMRQAAERLKERMARMQAGGAV